MTIAIGKGNVTDQFVVFIYGCIAILICKDENAVLPAATAGETSADLHRVTVVSLVMAVDFPSWTAVASFLRVSSPEIDSESSLKSGIAMPSSIANMPSEMSSSSSDMPVIDFIIAYLLVLLIETPT